MKPVVQEAPAVPDRYAPPPGFVRKTKAEKRELKAAKMRELRGEWRRREREGRRKQVAQRAAERGAMLERMSEEERADFRRAERAEKERLEQEKREQNERLDAALSDGVRVVVDLSYGATMNLKEQRSLARQLGRCWGANRRAPAPVALHLASMQRCPAPCLPQDGDHKRWKVRLLDEDLEHHFSPSDLVFLSPDADEALTCVDESKVLAPPPQPPPTAATTAAARNKRRTVTASLPPPPPSLPTPTRARCAPHPRRTSAAPHPRCRSTSSAASSTSLCKSAPR